MSTNNDGWTERVIRVRVGPPGALVDGCREVLATETCGWYMTEEALAAATIDREKLAELLSSLSIAYANGDESHIEGKTKEILDGVCGPEKKEIEG